MKLIQTFKIKTRLNGALILDRNYFELMDAWYNYNADKNKNVNDCIFSSFYSSKTDPVTGAVKNTKYHQL